MRIGDLLALGVLALVAVRLAGAVRVSFGMREHVLDIVRGVRFVHVLLAIPALVVVLSLAVVLLTVPGLDFGWWTAIGGEGNPALGMTGGTEGTPLDVLVPVAFVTMLVAALPLLVWTEERIFRRGAQHRPWQENLGRCVWFGLAHAVVGIPIGAALALSAGGAYLTLWYLHGWRSTGTEHGALLASARAHLAYNAVIVSLVAVALAAGW